MTDSVTMRTAALAVSTVFAGMLIFPQGVSNSLLAPAKHGQIQVKHTPIAKIAPRPEDVSSIDGIVKAYYEVVSGPTGQPRQWSRDATLYIPGVRFVLVTEDKVGNATAQSMTHQEFVDFSEAALAGKPFFERECHRVVERVGNIAHVLSTAEQAASADGPFKVSGLDSLELFWDG